jgi:hypothetical protein
MLSGAIIMYVYHLIRNQDQGFFVGFYDVVKMVIIKKII